MKLKMTENESLYIRETFFVFYAIYFSDDVIFFSLTKFFHVIDLRINPFKEGGDYMN